MPLQYRTRDQHIWWKQKYIPPDTLVEVPQKDKKTWEALVKAKVAVRVKEELPAEEPLAEEPLAEEPLAEEPIPF